MKYPRIVKETWNYMKLNLELSIEQKAVLLNVLEKLERVKQRHTPPPEQICSKCGQNTTHFADTWVHYDLFYLQCEIDTIKAILGLNELRTDHT